MPLVLVSKTGTSVEFDVRILRFADGLESFDKTQPIRFSSIISTDFLNSLRLFYELNNFEKEFLDVKTENLEKDPKSNLSAHSPHTWQIFRPYYERFQKDNKFEPIVELLDCAEILKVSEFKEAVLTLLGTILHLSTSNYDIEMFMKRFKLKNNINQIMLNLLTKDQMTRSYNLMNQKLNANYKLKVQELFRQPINNEGVQPRNMFQQYQNVPPPRFLQGHQIENFRFIGEHPNDILEFPEFFRIFPGNPAFRR